MHISSKILWHKHSTLSKLEKLSCYIIPVHTQMLSIDPIVPLRLILHRSIVHSLFVFTVLTFAECPRMIKAGDSVECASVGVMRYYLIIRYRVCGVLYFILYQDTEQLPCSKSFVHASSQGTTSILPLEASVILFLNTFAFPVFFF